MAAGQTVTTDPPSTTVIVQENCTAQAGGYNIPATSVSADDNIGNSAIVTQTGMGGTPPTIMQSSAVSSGTRYTPSAGGPTVTLSCTPVLSGTANFSTNATVSYTASVSPVTITLGGTTQDTDGSLKLLTGQQVEAASTSMAGQATCQTLRG